MRNKIPDAMRVLNRHPDLCRLLQRVDQLQSLQSLFEQALAPELRLFFRVQSYQASSLTIQAASGVWASHLRFQQASLIENLKNYDDLKALKQLRVVVVPWILMHQPKPKTLPPAAKVAIEISAEGITQPKLKAALNRLASQCRQGY